MKIITKERMKYFRQVVLAGQTTSIEGLIHSATPTLYNKLFNEKLNEFIKSERNNPIYANNNFDENYIKKVFKARIKNNSDLMKNLPENTIRHIDNFNLLGLKCCSQKELIFLDAFYEKGLKIIEELTEKVRNTTEKAAKYLTQDINFDLLTEEVICGINEEKNNLILEFKGYKLIAENAFIIAKEQDCINEYDLSNPYCGMTVLHALELYHNKTDKSFELHLLLDNINSLDISYFWYLTVKCKDIKLKSI